MLLLNPECVIARVLYSQANKLINNLIFAIDWAQNEDHDVHTH